MSKRILVPIDSSEQARKTLRTALEEFGDRDITVLHVIDENALEYADSMLPSAYDRGVKGEMDRNLEDQARGLIENALDVAHEHGIEVDVEIEVGKPSTRIIEYVEENDIDYIVIGSHGHGGTAEVTRQLFGSVADRVVTDAPVPVMIVK